MESNSVNAFGAIVATLLSVWTAVLGFVQWKSKADREKEKADREADKLLREETKELIKSWKSQRDELHDELDETRTKLEAEIDECRKECAGHMAELGNLRTELALEKQRNEANRDRIRDLEHKLGYASS